jgi:hypothetical protein
MYTVDNVRYVSYSKAVAAAESTGLPILITATGATDRSAWQYARLEQSFDGDYADWLRLDDAERDEYEFGASHE